MIAGQIEIQLMADLARIKKDMDNAKNVVGGAMDSIERAVGVAKTALVGLGAGLSIAGFVHYMQGAIDAADHLNDLSKSTGIAATELSGLKLMAQQSGGDLDGIAQSINKLSVNMGKDADKFARIGVTAKDPIEAFKQLADVFVQIQDPQTRAAFGAEAVGKSWASAAPALSEGSARIAEMIEKGKRLSGVTQEMVENADKFNDEIAEMKAISAGLGTKLAGEILPAMTQITGAVKLAYEESGKLHALWIAMGALGAFLFTDEFASARTQVQNLQKEIEDIENKRRNYMGPSVLQEYLIGSDREIDTKIAIAQAKIAGLLKSMEKPAAKPAAGWTSGGDLPPGVANFIGDEEATKKYDAAIKKSEEYIAQIKKEAAFIGATTEEKKQYEAEQIAGQMRLAGVRDDVLLRFLNNALKESEALKARQAEVDAITASKKDFEEYVSLLDRLGVDRDKIHDQVTAQEDYNDRIGLSKDAIAALDAVKLDYLATLKEERAALADTFDWSGRLGDTYRDQAEDLRKLAELKKQGATKELASDKLKKDTEEAQKILDNLHENIQRNLGDELFNTLDRNFDNIGESFGRMVKRMIADAASADLMNSLMGKSAPSQMGALGAGFMKLIGMGGSASTSASYLADADAAAGLMSMDGGGFTGNGPRSGGMDGKGGFLAMMHPQETVIDHTKGQSGGGGRTVTVSLTQHIQIDSRSDRAQIMKDMMRMKEVTKAELVEEMNR